jgi:hypothetical protein
MGGPGREYNTLNVNGFNTLKVFCIPDNLYGTISAHIVKDVVGKGVIIIN